MQLAELKDELAAIIGRIGADVLINADGDRYEITSVEPGDDAIYINAKPQT